MQQGGRVFVQGLSSFAAGAAADLPRTLEGVMLATLAFAAALTAPQIARLDAVMRYVMHDRAIGAMSVGIVRDRDVTLRRYGRAKEGAIYPVGSLSKSFVAATALRLSRAGTLSLEMPVRDVDERFTAASGVTLLHLLTQTSGIADYAGVPGFDRMKRGVVSPRDLISSVASLPLRFAPGSDFEYSNTNYVLAGLAIERATRRPLIQIEHREIFEPLRMRTTRRSLASSQLYGAGDIESTAADMSAWLEELLAPRVLARDDVKRMTSGVPYGMGFFATKVYGMRGASASGYVAGYSSFMALIPSRHVAVVLLSNADRVDLAPAATSALAAALDIPE